ncbi:Wadjet anti-phage system protein JetD domain-containing protein [Pandoraea pnomenusa]|uniref:Wadjet anti-phage system protein JetD domain-containing protein n=1 Tax=Pandoraea pnomenusa TaxID=93220 RepID=UPI00333E9167
MKAAVNAGAIELHWDNERSESRSITRVSPKDVDVLALFLGRPTQLSVVERARVALDPWRPAYPVLDAVLARWEKLFKVRGIGPERANDWTDALAVIESMRRDTRIGAESLPVREVSATLLHHSKRIEQILTSLDVLLSGDIDSAPRQANDVLAEIGLCREDQPVRLAGAVTIIRERVTALLDMPYGAFPASTLLGTTSSPKFLLTIENQTTFHSEARRRCNDNALLMYTAGMPSPAWRAAYQRLIESVPLTCRLMHWGDVDEGGFRIASNIAEVARQNGRELLPYKMSPSDVPENHRRPATEGQTQRMRKYAERAGWLELANAVTASGFISEQEALAS